MRLRTIFSLFAALFLALFRLTAAPDSPISVFRKAKDLYQRGMYVEARTLFLSLGKDPQAKGYAALCALKLRASDSREALADLETNDAVSILIPRARFIDALNKFDDREYADAASAFDSVDEVFLEEYELPEFVFKRGYCDYALGDYASSKPYMYRLDTLPPSQYSAPGRYALAYMLYTEEDFAGAQKYFTLSSGDPRFRELSEFYILDCRFMQHDYNYVADKGPAIYDASPKERQPYLSRILSESFLILGDSDNAKKYYDLNVPDSGDATRSDFFFSGSLLYGIGDYKGAIEKYNLMLDRSDSLGQIANYQLGYSYIKTKNKVAALKSFEEASSASFDPVIAEDAHFNFAKLAFDLNQDPKAFESYNARYSMTKRGDLLYRYMALAALYNHNYQEAIDAYDNIEELDPDMTRNYAKANYLRARQLIQSGSFRDAVNCLKFACKDFPSSDPFAQLSRFWMGECYYNLEKYTDAADTFLDLYNASALDSRPEGKLIPYNLAYSYFRQGDYDHAATWFSRVASGGDKTLRKDALTRRADCDFGRKDYAAAVDSYGAVLSDYYDVNDIYPYFQQALATGLSGKKKNQAKADILRKVLDASPEAEYYPDAMYELGRTYLDLKKTDSATEVFSKLRENSVSSLYAAKALMGLGMASRNARKYDEALGYYKSVVEMMKGTDQAEDALLAIESIYTSMNQPQKYIQYLESSGAASMKSETDKESIVFNTARNTYLSNNWSETVALGQKYLEEFPSGPSAYDIRYFVADSYRHLDMKEKACDAYLEIISGAPAGSPAIENSLLHFALLTYSLERYQESASAYSSLAAVSTSSANSDAARVGLMRSTFRAKDFQKSLDASRTVLSGKTDAALSREAKFVSAKSLLALNRRDEAFDVLRDLSASASTDEGAEARYLLIQDAFNRADFNSIESLVYDFARNAGNQSYWLAKSYVILADSFAERGNLPQAKATYESLKNGYVPKDADDEVPSVVEDRLRKLSNSF